jgi:hypothetical protein
VLRCAFDYVGSNYGIAAMEHAYLWVSTATSYKIAVTIVSKTKFNLTPLAFISEIFFICKKARI